jgi:hypothetical protein
MNAPWDPARLHRETAPNHPDDVWVFDVDGTLIGSIRSDKLRPGAEELLELLARRGTTVVVWSAGGAEYAERMLDQFGLTHQVSAFYHKETRGPDGRYLVDHLPPEHRPGTLVDDYPDDVPDNCRVIRVRQFLGGNTRDTGLNEALAIARSMIESND